jgi:uncharacterized surface protein with fasciclin (FAS1) repeats
VALAEVLTYHVVPGKVLAADIVMLSWANTVQGQSVNISVSGGVHIDGAHLTATDIIASNGVIHVIDAVILPSKTVASISYPRIIDYPFERNPGR